MRKRKCQRARAGSRRIYVHWLKHLTKKRSISIPAWAITNCFKLNPDHALEQTIKSRWYCFITFSILPTSKINSICLGHSMKDERIRYITLELSGDQNCNVDVMRWKLSIRIQVFASTFAFITKIFVFLIICCKTC
jgi:hypothetical protein